MQIDLVYTWVDSSDKHWQEKINAFTDIFDKNNKDSNNVCRFHNNDELKYSLRSVEINANWINKIFIITDNQIPKWLNTNNPKIKIINHQDIIPVNKLPFFNSCAIESRIPFIEELSEFFLYANDDTFFWNKVTPELFFTNEKPIVRVSKKINPKRKYKHIYGNSLLRAYNLIKSNFNAEIMPYFPHHNIDSYRKSLFLECYKTFNKEFEQTLNNKFRDCTDVQRMLVSFYSLAKNEAILEKTNYTLLEKLLKNNKSFYMFMLK